MGLFGALFAGVAGLGSQSNKIGIVSNNISNVNTVGYKEGSAAFNTLVVPSGSSGTFSPGGVLGNNRQLVSQQGLVQGTTSDTDMAISGSGLFVVNTKPDGTGDTMYTRAGSFTPDSTGNFKNSSGFFLQGLKVTTPATSLNANALSTVSVNQNATGSSVATSLITLAGNFNASQVPFAGAGEVATLASDPGNSTNTVSQIIVPTASNGLVRGQAFTTTTTSGGANTTVTYTYDGFKIGRNVVTGAVGDGAQALVTDSNTSVTTVAGDTTHIRIPVADSSNYAIGKTASISGVVGTVSGTVTAASINNQNLVISGKGSGYIDVTLPAGVTTSGAAATGLGGSAITATNRTYNFSGKVLDANSDSGDFLANSGSSVATEGKSFSISVDGNTYTYSYNSAPNTTTGQFNSMSTLVTAINSSSDGKLSASLVNHQLYISPTDATQGVTFANGNATGTDVSGVHTPGINWIQELDLQDIPAAPNTTGHRFNSLQNLADQINANDPTNVKATVSNATVQINAVDPQSLISFADAGTPTASFLKVLGFKDSTGGNLTGTGGLSTGTFGSTYNAEDATKNMSSGKVTPQFNKQITVYDALGVSHTIAMNVLKLSSLKWAVEFTAVPASDIDASKGGRIASGTITFNGDGSIADEGVFAPGNQIQVPWTKDASGPGADASVISFNLGTPQTSNGLSQVAGSSNISQAIQNGSPTGQLTGVTIDADGFVTASFSNGQTQKLYQIPIASVNNYNGMESVSGNAYKNTLASGDVALSFAGQNGAGVIAASALEQSNVDLSTQLTDLIVAQQAYGANTRVLTVTSQLLQQLNQIIQ